MTILAGQPTRDHIVNAINNMRRQVPLSKTSRTYTNLSTGPTESSTDDRVTCDLTDVTEVRCAGHVSTGGTTGTIKIQYATDASTFADLTTTFSVASTGLKESTWQACPAAARDLVILRVVGAGGNGSEDPVVNAVCLECR